MVSIRLMLPIVQHVGWRWALASLAIGPVLRVVAIAGLRAPPQSLELAGGRR